MARYFKIESFIGLATLPNAALLFWQTTILAVKIIQSKIINLNFCKLRSLSLSLSLSLYIGAAFGVVGVNCWIKNV
jgi:hypothetical protein